MSQTLVAYFSASGVTAGVAKKLAEAVKADLFEICPAVPYTREDLNWRNKKSRSSVEMSQLSFRPAMTENTLDVTGYNTVYLGFPIWWYIAPTIINTFLESHDFAGKTIVLFATSGGSGFGKTLEHLAPSCPGAVIRESEVFHASVSTEQLRDWIEKNA